MSADRVVARDLESSQGSPGRDDRVEMMMGMGRVDDRVERGGGGGGTYFIDRNPS